MSKSKFFIAILPPKKISKEILEFQKEIESNYGAKHAQKAPPHITVIPPFDANEVPIESLIKKLQLYDFGGESIEIKLENFQTFDQRTLFVDVAKNERLEHFSKAVKLLFNHQKIIPQRQEKHFFVPHITLANRDLRKSDFKAVANEFKKRIYQRNFFLNQLSVLKLEGRKWELFEIINVNFKGA